MPRLTDWLTRWGPCIWLATCGLMVDLWTGVWGPGLVVGGLIGFVGGRRRWRVEQQERCLQARAADGLNGLYEPEPFDDWELEDDELDPRQRPGD
ncbi:hypothetical protein PMI01_01590 [Caulobacter sp. AP07]|nr:hypothetical protein PMI01_01590 [Caulobacter sp. AP07]